MAIQGTTFDCCHREDKRDGRVVVLVSFELSQIECRQRGIEMKL